MGGEEVEVCGIEKDTFRHNSLQEFATAFKERDWLVGFCNPVIYFTGFRDGDHSCRMPRVVPKAYSGIEYGGQV